MTDRPPDSLDCGKTIEDLGDYIDAGRSPSDPSIDNCPECRAVMEALERVSRLSRTMISDDAERLPPLPESWYRSVVAAIQTELRAGRSLPISHPDPRVTITVTEGAVRALLRATGDSIDGLFVGKTEIAGDAEVIGAPVEINLSVTVAWGSDFKRLTGQLRTVARDALAQHTELNVRAINILVEDLHGFPPEKDAR